MAGLIAESVVQPSRMRFFVAGLVGVAGIYLCGALWLATWLSMNKGTNWVSELASAWQLGVLPFLLVDAGKAIVASGITLSGHALAAWFKSLG